MMGHVNNARYLTYFENARVEHLTQTFGEFQKLGTGIIIAHAEIDYKAPATLNDELTVRIKPSSVGNTNWTYEYEIVNEKQENNVIARGKTVQVTYDYRTRNSIPIPEEVRKILLKQMEEANTTT